MIGNLRPPCRVGGQGGVRKRLLESENLKNLILVRHASCTRGTGPADPNAPSGASTAGPVLVDRHLGAVDCVLQGAGGGSTF
jgi:hypothetical protein